MAACYQLAFFMNLPTPWDWLLASIFLISSGYAVIWATRRGLLFAGDAGFSRYMADEAREWGMDNPETMGVELAGVSAPERWLYWKLTGAERVTPDIVERGQKRGLLLFTAIASLITLLFIITMALNA